MPWYASRCAKSEERGYVEDGYFVAKKQTWEELVEREKTCGLNSRYLYRVLVKIVQIVQVGEMSEAQMCIQRGLVKLSSHTSLMQCY
jgi:hypothetical protein